MDFNELFEAAVKTPSQRILMFWNDKTKKQGEAEWRPLEKANCNFRGNLGEYSLSYYPAREKCYLAVSRETYPGSHFYSQGFITLQWTGKVVDKSTPVMEGILTLPNGKELKVRLRAPEEHESLKEKGKKFMAATLEIFGGRLDQELLEAVVQQGIASRDRRDAITKKAGTTGDSPAEVDDEDPVTEEIPF